MPSWHRMQLHEWLAEAKENALLQCQKLRCCHACTRLHAVVAFRLHWLALLPVLQESAEAHTEDTLCGR